MEEFVLGIDVGTSSVKVVLVDGEGRVVFATAPEYPFETPKPQWAEVDPELWWDATVKALKQMMSRGDVSVEAIAGIGLTGQMHGLVLLDAKGAVLRPCIMWNDQRTAAECLQINEFVGEERIIELTANPSLPGFTASKLLWVKNNEPEVFRQIDRVLLPKDYIRYRLSGAFASDVSDASGTGLLNVAERDWSDEMIEKCGFERAWFPEVLESVAVSGQISESAASETGLLAGTVIVAGGGDQAAQAVGCGIVREGNISVTLGTSGVVFAHSDNYRVDPKGRLHAFCSAVPGKWHLMGVMLSAAGSFQWFRNRLGGEERAIEFTTGADAYQQLTLAAADAPVGSEGCIFLPYLSGERAPYADPDARGAFFGLSLRHGKSHMTRAVLEGVTYGLRDMLELMRELGLDPKLAVASGGGARSELWRQIIADNFQIPNVTVNATEGAAYGAALLAAVAVGIYESVEAACDATIKAQSIVEVNEAHVPVYSEYHAHYQALYPALKERFAAMARTVERYT